ncbi:hypothetical protein FSP39_008626 [Pinctada imbricata]|uniref:Sorting nexin-17 n=1 Tax=Pinctada imbricata TaxID=66713 RepID=A0AA89BU97_PINIB|nr:hypothetical protein FSP39_008626 [Pinctada imbricata]
MRTVGRSDRKSMGPGRFLCVRDAGRRGRLIPDFHENSFNIHINGVFHCTIRYSHLFTFYETLKREFGAGNLPPFPPKKFLPLSPIKVEERRQHLERFIQIVSQDPQISNSDVFNGFFLNAQQETQKEKAEAVSLDVFLMNGHKITVKIMSTDQTDDVLESVASQIELPDEFVYYFGLFLVQKEEEGDNSLVRKLQEFESPFISLKYANKQGVHRIVLRKSFWDSSYEDDLLDNKVAMNLLYIQAVSDIERLWTLGTKEQIKHLATLQQRGSKREYLRLARTMKYYGYIQFKPCYTDYPNHGCRVLVAAGHRELNFRIQTDSVPEDEEIIMDKDRKRKLELSFEYLMAKDTLQWISLTTDQAILISMCLQSMVDELIMKKQGKKMKKPQDRPKGGSAPAVKRDNSYGFSLNKQFTIPSPDQDEPKGKNDKNDKSVISNNAFDTIGDDDL